MYLFSLQSGHNYSHRKNKQPHPVFVECHYIVQKYKAVLSSSVLPCVFLFCPLRPENAINQTKQASHVNVCVGISNMLAYGSCIPVCICVRGLHACVHASVQTVMVPPSENRWVFCVLLHTLPLTLQGRSITARNKHPVFGSQAQEVSVYCYWACVSY